MRQTSSLAPLQAAHRLRHDRETILPHIASYTSRTTQFSLDSVVNSQHLLNPPGLAAALSLATLSPAEVHFLAHHRERIELGKT